MAAGREKLDPLSPLGRGVLALLAAIGAASSFIGRAVWATITPPWYGRPLLRQLWAMGYLSLPVVGLTAGFTGAALALNIVSGGSRINADQVLPQIVALGITRELGPVLTALMLAGRVSAAIAAEIGAMRTSEQIDALQTLSTDPFHYLIAPRLLAGLLAAPLLTAIADLVGLAGGWSVAVYHLDFDPRLYAERTLDFLSPGDVGVGLVKALVFGAIVALMGCLNGFRATGGARGVGRATTQGVVTAAVLVFAADYAITYLAAARP